MEPGDIIIDGGNSEYADTTVSMVNSFSFYPVEVRSVIVSSEKLLDNRRKWNI